MLEKKLFFFYYIIFKHSRHKTNSLRLNSFLKGKNNKFSILFLNILKNSFFHILKKLKYINFKIKKSIFKRLVDFNFFNNSKKKDLGYFFLQKKNTLFFMDSFFYVNNICYIKNLLQVYKNFFIIRLIISGILPIINKNKLISIVSLPNSIERYTVLRSPHIDKRSREQFEKKTYNSVILYSYSIGNNYELIKRLSQNYGILLTFDFILKR